MAAGMGPVLVAALLGSVVGLERQWHQGMAGLRTNALVAASSAAFVHLPMLGPAPPGANTVSLAASVITGIGFLGAGVILREGMNVRGLNTAATLWGSAAIGAYAGTGLSWQATVFAAVILAINVLFRPVIGRLNRLGAQFSTGAPVRFVGSLDCDPAEHDAVRAAIVEHARRLGLHLRGLRTATVPGKVSTLNLEFDLVGYGRIELTVERLMSTLGRQAGVCGFSWSHADPPEAETALHAANA